MGTVEDAKGGVSTAVRLAHAGPIARRCVIEALAGRHDLETIEATSLADLTALTGEVDALVISDPRGPEGALLAASLRRPEARVRWVQVVSAGYSGLLSHKLPETVVVTNQGGAAAPAVAEHALALLLAHYRQLPAALVAQSGRTWDSTRLRGTLRTLEGSAVAILGVGHVGLALADRLVPFNVRRIGVTREGEPCPALDRTFAITELDAALAEADSVVACLPDSTTTKRLIDAGRLAAMKPGALLVNVGRGAVVDTDALAQSLLAGRLGGAALDVVDPEPLPDDHPLWRAPNLIVTPHVAGGGSPLTRARIAELIAENAARFISGAPLLNQVHPQVRI